MPRLFDGANDNVKMSIGACSLTGAWSIVIVMRQNAASSSNYANLITVQGGSIGPSQYGLEIESTSDGSQMQVQSGNTGFTTSTFTVGTADGWCLIAAGKAAGTATPRVHKYVYSSNTWTHQNAAGSLGNPASSAGGVVSFGEWENGLDDFNGDIAAAAVFDRNLADTDVESLAHSLQAWLSAAPVGMWVFDQAATGTAVNDWAGGGANQTSISGTAVGTVSAPGPGYGQDVMLASVAPAAGGAVDIAADLSVTAALAADGAREAVSGASLAVSATPAAGAAVTDLAAAALSVTAALAAAAVRETPTSAALAVTAATSAVAGGTAKPVAAASSVAVTLVAAGAGDRPASAVLSVTATSAAAATREPVGAALLAVTAAAAAAGQTSKPAAAALAVTATGAAAAVTGLAVASTVTATLSAAATRSAAGVASLSVTATGVATLSVTRVGGVSLTVSVTGAAGLASGFVAAAALVVVAVRVAEMTAAGQYVPAYVSVDGGSGVASMLAGAASAGVVTGSAVTAGSAGGGARVSGSIG